MGRLPYLPIGQWSYFLEPLSWPKRQRGRSGKSLATMIWSRGIDIHLRSLNAVFRSSSKYIEWERESLSSYIEPENPSSDKVATCPHHPSNTAWWWRTICPACRIVYESRLCHKKPGDDGPSDALNRAYPLAPSTFSTFQEFVPDDYDESYRFGRWPNVSAYPVSRHRLPPERFAVESGSLQRCPTLGKVPQRLSRKGSDTNPFTFTGKMLSIKREGLDMIGRKVEGAKTTNSSGLSWKC
jgi:hypothetical protein